MPEQEKSGPGGKGSMTVGEAGRLGGISQGKENNPGNFANDPGRASEAGRKGGQHSHDHDPGRGGGGRE
jgi:general stress protein YciG